MAGSTLRQSISRLTIYVRYLTFRRSKNYRFTLIHARKINMARAGAITFKGNPMTLLGSELNVGSAAPEFKIHFFEGGLKTITLADLKGKPTFISVVPSLDTGTCQIQTKKFNVELAGMGDKVNALTVSRDLPFAMNRFCGAEDIKSMKVGSDYQDGNFGLNFGLMIDELKLLARAVYVLDANGNVVYKEIVSEVAQEPDYAPAMAALKTLL
jgi:thioredoxin-dependent peroxiredoxin